MMESSMVDAIQHELSMCEQDKGIRTLLAVESGSRCWEFPSENSDWDVRFVYARPKHDYLHLEDVRDNIEWRLDDDFDVVGWDISKFLKLLRNSNPTAFEWLGSTIVYREEQCFQPVREVASRCFKPASSAHHYHGMAEKNITRYIQNGNTTKKRYLYAVRALLACRWSIEEQSPVPMAFEELKQAVLESSMVPLIDELVESKRSGLEKDHCEPIPKLSDWILTQEEDLNARITGLKSTTKLIPWSELDEIFLDIIA